MYKSLELFAGAGGFALGAVRAGFSPCALIDNDKWACATLRKNKPYWSVIEQDVTEVDFTPWRNAADVLMGGFPCQPFSHIGKKMGLEDARGTLFYEFARAASEVQPLAVVFENVVGLLRHDGGRTLEGMLSVLDEVGYEVDIPHRLNAVNYNVPQKRERVFLVAFRKDIGIKWIPPKKSSYIPTLRDALKAGTLYQWNVPQSVGGKYTDKKREVMELIPPGGNWRNLPDELQKQYLGANYYSPGGRTTMARRLSWDEPSLTLTCNPSQKQTERCHPDETRPLTVREYARIQTFPDDWEFSGSMAQQYKQIGNAVPVNLAYAVMRSVKEKLDIL